MSALWASAAWAEFWGEAGLLTQLPILLIFQFVFGFLLVLAARQTRSGYVVVATFVASFFLLPLQLAPAFLFAPVGYFVFSLGGMASLTAIAGGFTARASLLRTAGLKDVVLPAECSPREEP